MKKALTLDDNLYDDSFIVVVSFEFSHQTYFLITALLLSLRIILFSQHKIFLCKITIKIKQDCDDSLNKNSKVFSESVLMAV